MAVLLSNNSCSSLFLYQVFKKEVDDFSQDKMVPHCHYKAKTSGNLATVPDLECEIDILGSKRSRKLKIDFTPFEGIN